MAAYLVVGGSSGIGLQVTNQLAAAGHTVYATYNTHVVESVGNIHYHALNVLEENINLDFLGNYTTLVYQLLCMFLATLCLAMYVLTQFNYGYMEAYKAQIDMLRQRTEGQSKQLIVLEERYKQQQLEFNAFKSRTIAVETNLQYEVQQLKSPQKSITHLKR